MNYQQQQSNQQIGAQQQQQNTRPMRAANPTSMVPQQNMSPNVVPSPQQQMSAYQQMPMYHHGGTPFSPHNQQQQMMMMQQQPLSQQMQQPLSNAPATPATPQQQLQQPQSIGGPSSVHNLQQPGSVQHQQPGSVGMPTPSAGVYSVGAAPHSTGGPASNPPPMSNQSVTQQQSQQQTQIAGSSATATHPIPTQTEFDPIATAKSLILKDLRRSIMYFNQCTERVLDCYANPQQQNAASTDRHEDRRTAVSVSGSVGGPHSNLGLGGGPHSNLGLGPHSVHTPLSVQNPQSVNPQSVAAVAPGSVKSTGDEQGGGGIRDTSGGGGEDLSVAEQYELAKNQFMSVCDNIERNMQLVLEVYRQQSKLYNQQANSAVAWLEISSQIGNASITLPQIVRGYTELMNADKQAIRNSIDSLNQLLVRLGGQEQSEQKNSQEKIEPMDH